MGVPIECTMVGQGSNPSRSACGHRCSQLCPYKYRGMSEKKGSQRRFIIMVVLWVILILNGMELYLNNSTS